MGRPVPGFLAAAAALLLTAGCTGPAARPATAARHAHPAGTVPGGPLPGSTVPGDTAGGPVPGGTGPASLARATPAARPGRPRASAGPGAPTAPGNPAAPGPRPAPPPCLTSGLRVSTGPANGAAGSIYYPLEFTSTSASACTMYGYPGVSFVSRPGGRQLGGAATRNPTFPARLVTLAPGATAHASLQVEIAQDYPAATCKPVTAHWLRIYPPGQYVPLYLAFTAQTCTGAVPGGSTLGIYVVRPGSSGP